MFKVKLVRKCKTCRKPFAMRSSFDKYCSPGCMPKDGTKFSKARTPLKQKGKKAKEWDKFRKAIKPKPNHRGNYICDGCAQEVQNVDGHHVKKRSLAPESVLDPHNIQWLCRDCHRLIHNQ